MSLHDWLWPGFLAFIGLVLFFDLFVLHRKHKTVSERQALLTVGGYVAMALIFGGAVFWFGGPNRGAEFLTGYLIEQALSFDNIFVIAIIFGHFKAPAEAQHRVLFYGIVGAILMRLALILPGAKLIEQFHIVALALGALLIFSGFRLLLSGDKPTDPGDSRIVKFLHRTGRVTDDYHGTKFVVRRNGVLFMTPLFVVLVTIELTDIAFAIDSIPAVLAISSHPFIVFSSNVFAVMSLRAMYFVLSGMIRKFRFLKAGLSLVLMFIGAKMLLEGYITISPWVALGVTATLIGGAVGLSVATRSGGTPA